MSFLQKLGKIVNKVTNIASVPLGFIPGVGPVVAGAVHTAGDLAGGHNLGESLKSGVKTGALSYLGGKVLGPLLKAGGASVVGGSAGGTAASNIANAAKTGAQILGTGPGGIPMIVAKNPGAASGWLSKLGSIGSIANSIAPHNPDGSVNWGSVLGSAVKYGLPAAGAISASKTAGKADKYRDQAIKMAQEEYAQAAPLRAAGLAGMQNQTLPALGSIFNQPRPVYRRLNA